MDQVDVFAELLKDQWKNETPEALSKLVEYYRLVILGNSEQNLTRIIEPRAFFEDNLKDAVELLKSGFLGESVFDLGSGAGLPGIPTAILDSTKNWILCDSEGSKARFLMETAKCLGLGNVSVSSERAEIVLKSRTADTVCARAVGTVDKIFNWISNCSTWNNLVLLKGPAWKDEWSTFNTGRNKNKLFINAAREYSVGDENKYRILVNLQRKK